jgi:hypothetical protein
MIQCICIIIKDNALFKLPNLLKFDINMVLHQGQILLRILSWNINVPDCKSRLSNSSKNSGIDVNQSQYFTVMEVSLLNLLKLVHNLCAWAVLKRELPPSSDKQKRNNQSALCFVSNSINQQGQPYIAAPLDIHSLAQCAATVRRLSDIQL